jgi:hypothetical protein
MTFCELTEILTCRELPRGHSLYKAQVEQMQLLHMSVQMRRMFVAQSLTRLN